MYEVGVKRLQVAPDKQGLQEEALFEALKSLDTSRAPHKVCRELERLRPDTWELSKASVQWSIGAFLRVKDGGPDTLIAMINKFKVQRLHVGKNRNVEVLAAVLEACPSLRDLRLSEMRVHDAEAGKLASALVRCGHVSRLDLKLCKLSIEAWGHVADALDDMHGLERLHVQTEAGKWLNSLGSAIGRSSSLTSLALSFSKLTCVQAQSFGEVMGGNRSLTSLVFEVEAECVVAESFLKGLVAPAAHLPGGPLPRLGRLSLAAHRPKASVAMGFDEEWFSRKFCDLLVRQIETRSALEFVRVEPGIYVDQGGSRLLSEALRKNLVEFDIKVRKQSHRNCKDLRKSLRGHLALRKHMSVAAPFTALKAAARALLTSIPVLGGSLPGDIADQIVPLMVGVGDGSLRQRWARHGWIQVNKAAYNASAKARSEECVRLLVKSNGRARRSCSVGEAMRLQFSGVQLRDSDRARLSKAFPKAKQFEATRRKAGQALVCEHLGLARHLLKHRNLDGALFALETVKRLVKACRLEEPWELEVLKIRIALRR